MPEEVDTNALAEAALAEGVAINPGAEWSTNKVAGSRKLSLCFANPSKEVIREEIAKLAQICHRETGIPLRSGNIQRS